MHKRAIYIDYTICPRAEAPVTNLATIKQNVNTEMWRASPEWSLTSPHLAITVWASRAGRCNLKTDFHCSLSMVTGLSLCSTTKI